MAFNHKAPDYSAIFAARAEALAALRKDPGQIEILKAHYKHAPWDFVQDWGMTFEPRNLELGRLAFIPFVLWPKQVEYMRWLFAMWQARQRGLVEKSRDCGVSWLSAGFAVAMWLFWPGFTVGFGSRKEELVDSRGDPKSLFEKIRTFIDALPVEFLPQGWNPKDCYAHMRVLNPENGSSIIGEAGDNIGRGGRASIYMVDEAAFVEHQDSVDKALSQTTNCQIDISTPNGNGNAFFRKRMRFNNTDRVFVFDWRDDPRKDDAWYKQQLEEQDEVTVAQEIDRDYNASAEDAFIPAKWVAAAIDAHIKLGFSATGIRATGFDPADVGDAKALVHRHGSVVKQARQMMTGTIATAVPWAFEEADNARSDVLVIDGDGMGAPVMKVYMAPLNPGRVKVLMYHGSGGVVDAGVSRGRKHTANDKRPVDMYLNYRAQTWSWVRERFRRTFEAMDRARQGMIVNIDPDDLISISSACDCLHELQAELSRPRRILNANGKIQVESKQQMKSREVDSPNLADALVMAFSARYVQQTSSKITAPVDVTYDPGVGY